MHKAKGSWFKIWRVSENNHAEKNQRFILQNPIHFKKRKKGKNKKILPLLVWQILIKIHCTKRVQEKPSNFPKKIRFVCWWTEQRRLQEVAWTLKIEKGNWKRNRANSSLVGWIEQKVAKDSDSWRIGQTWRNVRTVQERLPQPS